MSKDVVRPLFGRDGDLHGFGRLAEPPIPPSNTDAEIAFLGALLANNKVLDRAPFLEPHHFAQPVHGRIFEEARRLIGERKIADSVTLKTVFEQSDMLEEVGGPAYLSHCLANMVVGIINAGDYARVVRNTWLQRELIDIGERLVIEARGLPDGDAVDPVKTAMEAVALIDKVVSGISVEATTSLGVAAAAAIKAMKDAKENKKLPGISTGFHRIDERLGGLEPQLVYVIGGRPGMGKQQPTDTPILTPAGWVALGDVMVGDFVIGRDGRPTRILAVHDRGVEQAYRVWFRDGTSTECGSDHLWTVQPSGGRGRLQSSTRTLSDLVAGGLCAAKKDGRIGAKWRIPLVSAVEFTAKSLPIDPYVLGVLIGDGALSGSDLRFSNPDFDSDIRIRVSERLPQDVSLYENRSGSCPYFSLRGTGRAGMKATITSLGLAVKSQHKFIPQIYLVGSVAQRMDLLRGLMDTDGSCLANRTIFYTTAEPLAAGVAHLVRSLGGVAIIRKYNREDEGKPTEFCVNVRMEQCPFSTQRKAAHWRPTVPGRYIVGAEPSRRVEQRCITVEASDGLYVANDYIVTHNSALGHQIAINAAKSGVGVLEWSLEMSAVQLGRRALAAESGVPLFVMKRGIQTDDQERRLDEANELLQSLPLTIDDTAGQTPRMLATKARAAKRKHGLGLIMLDHLNLTRPDDADAKHGATFAIEKASGTMLQIAKDCNVAVLLLTQLNRGVEGRDDKRPGLQDLRQSGSIEQDAFAVGLVYREEYYLQNGPEKREGEDDKKYNKRFSDWNMQRNEVTGKAEIIWGKVRDGQPGTDVLRFDGKTTSFSER